LTCLMVASPVLEFPSGVQLVPLAERPHRLVPPSRLTTLLSNINLKN
jgi:hypothetical protein